MPTEYFQTELDLGRSGGRKLVGAFDGGHSLGQLLPWRGRSSPMRHAGGTLTTRSDRPSCTCS